MRNTLTTMAQQNLTALTATAAATPAQAPTTASIKITARGFLPAHPVTISADGTNVGVVTANSAGNVTYTLHPSTQNLAAGSHTIALTGLC